ncbi:hypothetical protein JX266_014328 [Neoarthrinium moseri]|nr:hypothetical protein JX266_014328 [Neoarthrinium moseri]
MPWCQQAILQSDDTNLSSQPPNGKIPIFKRGEFFTKAYMGDASRYDVDSDDEEEAETFGGNTHPPEYYRKAIEDFDEAEYDGGNYSEGSLLLLKAIEEQWNQFCSIILRRDPVECFRDISVPVLYHFFDWSLNQKVGKAGRKKRGIKTRSALGTNWKILRLVFERATGSKLDAKINRRMHTVLSSLGNKYDLSGKKRANRCMTVDDLKEQIQETLSTTRKSFHLGELRILAVLFLLLLAPAGSRPASILQLRYGDIRIVLARDPEGGPHVLLIRFTLEFTKTYLGSKDAKTFTLPESIFDGSLLLNTHIFLLGILFRHQAFRSPSLVAPHQLNELDIHPGEHEMPLPLRSDLQNVYVFRRAVKTLTGYEISPEEPISYGMMAGWLRRIGELLGIEHTTIPYNLRYNAANELDRNPSISAALRNLALDHANSDPFQKHYLGREVCADVWAIVRGAKQQQTLLKQACSVGHSVSRRRPADLTAEQAASVNTHPRIRSEKQALRRALKKETRDAWTDEQAVEDIECQLRGDKYAESPRTSRPGAPQRPAQQRLLQAILAPVSNTLEGQYQRRSRAIQAIIVYCEIVEVQPVHAGRTDTGNASTDYARQETSSLAQAVSSVFIESSKERSNRCFLCIGAALSLESDDPSVERLIRAFSSPGDLTKHFRRRHLSNLASNTRPECKVCNVVLAHKMHLQNHALLIHGTRS